MKGVMPHEILQYDAMCLSRADQLKVFRKCSHFVDWFEQKYPGSQPAYGNPSSNEHVYEAWDCIGISTHVQAHRHWLMR